jgi:hypothetical protein
MGKVRRGRESELCLGSATDKGECMWAVENSNTARKIVGMVGNRRAAQRPQSSGDRIWCRAWLDSAQVHVVSVSVEATGRFKLRAKTKQRWAGTVGWPGK